jgi:predicted O-linked N-acetylglucosamine transferase (SPINDLY family)
LFDLSANTGDNRLDTFVLKPAPIQISYCGYPGSSGINSMDYHLTDKIADKPGFSEKYYSEKLIWMKNCFLCYTPSVTELPVLSEPPCIKNGYITFGTFNRFNKINKLVLSTWNEILLKTNARFIIKTKEFTTEKLKKQFMGSFDDSVLDRITILEYSDLYTQHLPDYNKMDVSLDTFPYSGTTTSCESLLMGVPVLTYYDNVKYYHSQNVTSSLMIHSNLRNFVAYSREQYIQKAVEMSQIKSKETIRTSFINSPVYDHEGFANDFGNTLIDTYYNHF